VPDLAEQDRRRALRAANKILQQCRISPSKTVGGLSERQRTELVELLRRRTAR